MTKRKVAIQGIEGCYHDAAAHLFFEKDEVSVIPCATFKDVFKKAKRNPETIAMVAIENTIAGSLLQNYELIRKSGMKICGEHKLRIRHCICALPGQSLDDLHEVYSHPIALMQCADFLDKHSNLRVVEYGDTADSARMIAQKQMKGAAAICSTRAAKLYGLEILKESIETNKHNFTRFLVLVKENKVDEIQHKEDHNKSSLVFSVAHEVGALTKVLTILSFYDINLTKIQSLPIIGREWEYLFYIDLSYVHYERYRQAIDAIMPLTRDLVVLGNYKEGKQTI